MKILVLGANGAVGQLAIDELLKANHEVKALVRNASTLSKSTPASRLSRAIPQMRLTWSGSLLDKTPC